MLFPSPPKFSPKRISGICLALLTASFLPPCALPVRADITYTLHLDDSPEAQQVAASVETAAELYNTYGSFNKHWDVYYNSGIPTAEGSYSGYMGYGSQRTVRTALHEGAHTLGMGTGPNYHSLISGGVWGGEYANQVQFDTYNDYADGLHGDGHAIWPGGMNYEHEDGFIQRIWMIRIQAALRADMGIMSYTREARNEAVVAGETAVFHVESPMAHAWQWYKDGVPLADNRSVFGTNTATLTITNAGQDDEGSYHCAATGAGETLNSRARQLWVHAASQLGQWNFDGNTIDSANAHNGIAHGTPSYAAGRTGGQAIDLDGSNDYIDLPDEVGRLRDLTLTTWVYWDGGNAWQRVFDFGTGTYQYLFLTPQSGSGTMRLVLKDAINAKSTEHQINTAALPTGQWVHLAAVLNGSYMTLYVNGEAVGSAFDLESSPTDFPATNNYIGKSQYSADPLFNGRIDDFQVHATALTGPEIWALWGQSSNGAPTFSSDMISLPNASALHFYEGQSLASLANDPDSDPLTYSKLHGPDWLTVAPDGAVSGQPGSDNAGENEFIVRVTDPSGASSDARLRIRVFAPQPVPVTASATPPATDGDDEYHLATGINESDTIDGSTNAANNDESTYIAPDRSSKGQTFTTGSHPNGYFLQSFTVQHVNWPNYTRYGTFADVQPGDQFALQIGTLSGTTKTPLMTYVAEYDGTPLTSDGDSGTGQYLTFNVSGMGIDLAPNTTYYFEIAPGSGGPYFELNSSGTDSYSGGVAYRGNSGTDDGVIATGVNPLVGDYIFHGNLLPASPTTALGTVAYWSFEEGTADTYVSYSRTGNGRYDGSIPDRSGNANHLSVWGDNWHWYRAAVPETTTPQTGAQNQLSLQNAGNYPTLSAIGTSLTTWSPTEWTLEAGIRPDDATNGYQTFIGRDSQGAYSPNPALAALYFSVTPDAALRILFTDAAGNNWSLNSIPNLIKSANWHAVAATSDGGTLSLYLKNLTEGDADYTLLGTLDISSSDNPAISTGSGDGSDWDAGVFSIARGLYNGGHADRFFGHLDDIRFSDRALSADQFLYTPALTLAEAWRKEYFGTTENSGSAANDADPDSDGTSNLLERAFGGDPNTAETHISPVIDDTASPVSIIYRKSSGATDLSFTVQETADLDEPWIPAIGSESLLDTRDGIQEIRFTRPASDDERLFLRLRIVAP